MGSSTLSNQAVGAIMLALQKGILEEVDITEIIKGFNLIDSNEGLVVVNPPQFEIPKEVTE